MKRKQRRSRKTKDTIVIVCGRTKTEVNYFKSFRLKIGRLGKVRVEVIGTGSNTAEPIALVKKAISLKDSDLSIAAVWAVFDKDNFDLGPAIDEASFRDRLHYLHSCNIVLDSFRTDLPSAVTGSPTRSCKTQCTEEHRRSQCPLRGERAAWTTNAEGCTLGKTILRHFTPSIFFLT